MSPSKSQIKNPETIKEVDKQDYKKTKYDEQSKSILDFHHGLLQSQLLIVL